jgi:MBG domain-containing protein
LTFGPRAADGHGTLAASSNYTLSYTGANLTVTARPITVTANSETIPVGAPDPAYTFGVTSGNLVNGDAFSGRLIRVPGETAGSYPVLIGSLSAGSNYLLTYIGGSLTIAPVEQPVIPVNNSPVIETAQFGVYPSSFVSDNALGYGDYGFGSYAVGSNDYGFASNTLGNNEYAFVFDALVNDGNGSASAYHGTDPDGSACTPVGAWKRLNRYDRIDLTGGNSAICK